jgi:hypothetical protein
MLSTWEWRNPGPPRSPLSSRSHRSGAVAAVSSPPWPSTSVRPPLSRSPTDSLALPLFSLPSAALVFLCWCGTVLEMERAGDWSVVFIGGGRKGEEEEEASKQSRKGTEGIREKFVTSWPLRRDSFRVLLRSYSVWPILCLPALSPLDHTSQ